METTKQISKKGLIVALVLLVLLAAAFAVIYTRLTDKPVQGTKTISVTVRLNDREDKTISLTTAAETLRGALEEKQLIAGTESEYGLMVTEVDGVKADAGKQEWWCFTQNGQSLTTGVDSTMIKDGDAYEITLTIGW